MSSSQTGRKPRVVSLGLPKHDGGQSLADFKREFDYAVLDASNHQEVRERLPAFIAQTGPIDAFIVPIGTAPYEPFDEGLFGPLAPHCRIIASSSAGYDEFDVGWMTSRGIWFTNTTDAVAEATADMAIYLVLSVVRDAYRTQLAVRAGSWNQGLYPTRDPSGMTLGIIGMGSIGKHTARKAAVFNMKVKYHSRRRLSEPQEAACNATYCPSLHDLLSESDVVSVSCPLTAETTNLLSTAEFAAMKDGAFLVNTARGAVVDEDALIAALESGKVARAGMDVFAGEPRIREYFRRSDRVVVQPHMGGLTEAAYGRAERECFANVRALFARGVPVSPVNEVRCSPPGE